MSRYFLEVAYKGTNYHGFQIQPGARTIQGEVESALEKIFRHPFFLTGSSRTDAGVHARQNFFHFDTESSPDKKCIYNINAVLPPDIVVKNIYPVPANAHCRYDAVERKYHYQVYPGKNPFLTEFGYYFPFKPDFRILQEAAALLKNHQDFTAFSKRNTQVKTFRCTIFTAEWVQERESAVFQISANRFLRGMIRGLVATMLKTARGISSLDEFQELLDNKNGRKADFSAPPQGLVLVSVRYPETLLDPELNTEGF